MAFNKYLHRGPVTDYPGLIDFVNGSNNSNFSSSWFLDVSGIRYLSIQLHAEQSVAYSSGTFVLYGSNVDGYQVPLTPDRLEGAGSLSGTTFTLPSGGNFDSILTYKDLPRWVKPALTLGDQGSMVGGLSVHVFGVIQ